MKKTLSTIIIVFGAYTSTFAQRQKGDVELGVDAGYSYTVLDRAYGPPHKSSFAFGLKTDIYFSDRWSIEVKGTYDQRGWTDQLLDVSPKIGGAIPDARLSYITVPVLANWHFGKRRNWYLNFGPYAGFLTSAKWPTHTADMKEDIKEYFKSVNIGSAVGIGTQIPLTDNLKLFFEIQGQSGFTDILKNNDNSALKMDNTHVSTGLVFLVNRE